jgi:GNAT superfamily N-acetyltransferase
MPGAAVGRQPERQETRRLGRGPEIRSRGQQARVFHGSVDLVWLDPQHPDERLLAGAVAVLEAARRTDCPHELPRTVSSYVADLRHGWDGDPPVAAVHRADGTGRVVGVVEVSLPRRDNTHLGFVDVTVDPAVRRQGLGRALFEAATDVVRSDGRGLVLAECFDTAHSLAFATSCGLDRAIESVKRRQDLGALDHGRLDRMFASAEEAAADYELVRMPAEIPDDLMPAVVEMVAAINDAPVDDLDVEDEVFSADRVRAFHAAQAAHDRRMYQLAARHRTTGALAGHTVVGVEGDRPWHGGQFDTSVLRDHRGHRLGLLLKIGMLRWLAEAEPQLRQLDTWNAASNDHMIAVNETLGYEVVATATCFQRRL